MMESEMTRSDALFMPRVPAASVPRTTRSRLLTIVGLAELWLERRRQRRALLELSDALLKDIGVSRYEACREATKPFWRP
jgi:uncharacterized protein YjiS (DUF1127 family)